MPLRRWQLLARGGGADPHALALGITGAPLVANTGINAVDAPTVEAAITCPSCGLNITGNATMTVADATIISRKLAGFSGNQLTDGLALGSGTRNTPAAVQSFLLAGCGATGGTVTSITAGSGLTGGTITGSGTIAVDPAIVQRRVSASCAAGSSIRAIAADGTVTCQTDATGGAGTVTNVATGAGLTGGPVTTSGTIGLATTQLLPTTACGNNQIPKWNGSAWLCATEAAGVSGTVTNVATGLGLTGGPVTSTGTISADTTYLQRRVSASCAVGSSIRAIAADGTVTCQTDTAGGTGTVTNVASGTGLSGGPITATGTLSIANAYRLPQSCANGQLAKYNTTTQLWECAADNGGGGTVTNIATANGIIGGPLTTTGSLAIAPSYRLPQTCLNGQYTRYNNSLSVWECVTPVVVTNVANGPGLTGGPITSTGTVSLAATQLLPTTACTTDQIIKWNGSAWACASSTLALPTCVLGQYLQTNISGSIECGTFSPTITTVDSVGDVGLYSSMVLRANGRPVISYYDNTNGDLKVVECGSVACSSGNTITTIDSIGTTGQNTSIAMPADGQPVISYWDVTNRDLKVARCGFSGCVVGTTIATVDSVGDVGRVSSIFVPADGLPIISYSDATNFSVKVAKCGNAGCTVANTLSTIDTGLGSGGQHSSIFVPADGLPVISYYNSSLRNLKVAKCGNASCSSGNTLSTVDNTFDVGNYSSIVVPADGLPVISYMDGGNNRLKVAKCGNASCSSGNTLTTVDTIVSATNISSIKISADGLPVIAYFDTTNDRLKVAKCGNALCNAGNTLTTVDGAGQVGWYPSMVVPADGRPIISYWDLTNGDLQVVKCSNSACLNP